MYAITIPKFIGDFENIFVKLIDATNFVHKYRDWL